jgi:hypothetical protein
MKERDIAKKAATQSEVDTSTQMPNQEPHPTSLPPEE